MPAPITSVVYPVAQEWVGIGRELTTGTVVSPAITVPVEKPEPDDKPMWLDDKSLRGFMGVDYALIQGVECAEFDWAGPVYIDTLGHSLFNIFGDYIATGTTGSGSTTLTAQCAAGATTATVASITGFSNGQAVQLGITGDGNPEIVVLSAAPSGSTLTFTNTPARFTHASGKAVAGMIAPYTHTFALLNSAGGQPVTHTLTHYQGISGSFGAKQYASWCASEVGLTVNAEQLVSHATKGTSFLGIPAVAAPTNTISTAQAQPGWECLVGIGGPASGGTQVNNVTEGAFTVSREIKPWWGATGFQAPYIIARNGLSIAGKFTQLAINETPMLNMLNNVQPQVQMTLTNGKSGANLLAMTVNAQIAAYDTVKMDHNNEILYQVTWKAIMNTTNVGFTGGEGPGTVVLQNAIPTY